MPTFKGETKEGAPIIGAKFWKKGTSIVGTVLNAFETRNGKCYQLALMDEISVPGDCLYPKQKGMVKSNQFAVGALKGFEMALRAAGCGDLQEKDLVKVICTGESESGKGSPRINFNIEVSRR